jgi:hypothetical protein
MEDYGQHEAEELLGSEPDNSAEETLAIPPPPEAPPILVPEEQPGTYVENPSEVAVGAAAVYGQELRRRRDEMQQTSEDTSLTETAPEAQTEPGLSLQDKEAYETLANVTLPKLESSREKLRSRLGVTPSNEVEVDLATARAEQMIHSDTQPEEIMQTVELAAEQDIPIEIAYERRHERKGEETDDSSGSENSQEEPANNFGTIFESDENSHGAIDHETEDNQTVEPFAPGSMPKRPSLYIQAIKSGFWTAIALAVLVLLFVIVR